MEKNSTEDCSDSKKIKIETLKKERKAVFLEKNETEKRVESRLSDYKKFWRFPFQHFKAVSEWIVFQPKIHPKVETSQLRPLMENIEPVVMEIY